MTTKGLSFLIALLLVACATTPPAVRRGDRDFIGREEIEQSDARNALDLVKVLRPQWLDTRGVSTFKQAAGEEGIVVYMDNARMGLPDSMGEISLASVRYLRFFNAAQATQRWGSGHLHGAILISTQEP